VGDGRIGTFPCPKGGDPIRGVHEGSAVAWLGSAAVGEAGKMMMKLSEAEIQQLLTGPNRDLHLVALVKNWRRLTAQEKHDLVHLMSKFVLRHEVMELDDVKTE
jgi:hypothetical protein